MYRFDHIVKWRGQCKSLNRVSSTTIERICNRIVAIDLLVGSVVLHGFWVRSTASHSALGYRVGPSWFIAVVSQISPQSVIGTEKRNSGVIDVESHDRYLRARHLPSHRTRPSSSQRCRFDATHLLMSSITTSLDPTHRGQITGLSTFVNFVEMAIGALAFRRLIMPQHSTVALTSFAALEFVAGLLALYASRAEAPAAG